MNLPAYFMCLFFSRVYCPRNCMQANPHYARVIGSRVYSDVSILPCATPHISKYINTCTHLSVHIGSTQSQGIISELVHLFSEELIISVPETSIYKNMLV